MKSLLARTGLVVLLMAFVARAQTDVVPERTDDNVIVASYNIKWLAQTNHSFEKLADVIEHFDVCGILEIKDERALAQLIAALESRTQKDWGYVFGVRTHRPGGRYYEAYGAVWRRDRVELGDGIVSNVWDLEEAFRNDPLLVSFKRGNFDFTLLLVHTRWSDDEEGTREGEVAMLAQQLLWMMQFLTERDLIIAGDFNYPGTAEPMKEMASAAGLIQLDPDHKSTFKNDFSGYASAYDHIYVLNGPTSEYVPGSCQVMDATRVIYGDNSPENMEKSKQELSDHLPVWTVFTVTAPDDD